MGALHLVLPGRPSNANDRPDRWAKSRIVKEDQKLALDCALEQWGVPMSRQRAKIRGPVDVHVRHLFAHGHGADTVNCFPRVKAAVDALTDPKSDPGSRLWPKDTPDYVRAYVFYPPSKPTARQGERLVKMGYLYAPPTQREWLVLSFVWAD